MVESQMYVLKAAELVQKISDTVTLTAYILFDISPHIASTAQIGQNLDRFLKVTVCSNKAQWSATPKLHYKINSVEGSCQSVDADLLQRNSTKQSCSHRSEWAALCPDVQHA